MHVSSITRFLAFNSTIIIGALTLLGCNGSGGDGGTAVPVSAPGTVSQLYVSGNTTPRILVYNDANTVSGSTLPNRVVAGGLTTLSGPRGIAVDMARNQIYVANALTDSILIFSNARSATGGDAPDRTIIGAPLSKPSSLFIDVVNNRLYVANTNGNSVLIYDNASILNNSVAPTRTLAGVTTTLNAPTGIYVDTTRNLLYVANGSSQALVFNNSVIVPGNNNLAPLRTITILSNSAGIFVDVLADRLYVSNTANNSIHIFDAASKANSSSVPDRILSGGSSTLNIPRDIFVDTASDKLYVANFGSNSVLVFGNASTTANPAAPTRNLTLTASTGPWGVYVDVTPIVIGSTASLDGFIAFDGSAYSATSNGGSPRTGDDESFLIGTRARQFFSFDLSNIPSSVTVNQASLRLYQLMQAGTPFNDLGSVVVDHVDYGATLDSSPGDYDGGLLALLGVFSNSSTADYRALNITTRVAIDLINMRGHSQYRLRFSPLEINNDSASDYVQYVDAESSCCGVNPPPQLSITIQP